MQYCQSIFANAALFSSHPPLANLWWYTTLITTPQLLSCSIYYLYTICRVYSKTYIWTFGKNYQESLTLSFVGWDGLLTVMSFPVSKCLFLTISHSNHCHFHFILSETRRHLFNSIPCLNGPSLKEVVEQVSLFWSKVGGAFTSDHIRFASNFVSDTRLTAVCLSAR